MMCFGIAELIYTVKWDPLWRGLFLLLGNHAEILWHGEREAEGSD